MTKGFKLLYEDMPILPVLPYNGINPHSIVIMDNASIHHVAPVVQLIESTLEPSWFSCHLIFRI